MADLGPDTQTYGRRRRGFGLTDLRRLGGWGLAASAALAVAVLALSTDAGTDRVAEARAMLRGDVKQAPSAADRMAAEKRRLADAVQRLTADRDRLQARLDTMERNVETVTGSIARAAQAAAQTPASRPAELPPIPSAPPMIAALAAAPPAMSPGPGAASPAQSPSWEAVPVPVPLPQPAPGLPPQLAAAPASVPPAEPQPEVPAARAEFAIDLGVAPTVNGLRALWGAARARHGAALGNLEPRMIVRESTRPGGIELRLVAGPLPSAAAAAQLCQSLGSVSATCRPAAWEGQTIAPPDQPRNAVSTRRTQ